MEHKEVVSELKKRIDNATEEKDFGEAFVLSDFLSWYLENVCR